MVDDTLAQRPPKKQKNKTNKQQKNKTNIQ